MRYDFLSLPVVDQEDRLVGVVTVDDVMDVMEENGHRGLSAHGCYGPLGKVLSQDRRVALAKTASCGCWC